MTADFSAQRIDLAREADFRLGGIQVRPSTRQVEAGDESETLQPRIMQVLVALARRRGEVVSRDDLIRTCWEGRVVGEDALNRCIGKIRKLGETHRAFQLETIPRVGYRMDAEEREELEELEVSRASPSAPVLAVLAFDNLSGDPGMAFFSDGISDEILQAVSRGLRTIGRASSFQFRGADKAIRKVAMELGATHVLDGSVRRDGGLVRINAQLIESSSQVTIWQRQFDRPARDLFAVQDEIAVAVAMALNCELSPAPPTEDIDEDTYELFLRLSQGSLSWSIPARSRIDMADEVTRRAPRFGRGWLEAAQARATARRNTVLSGAESKRLYQQIQTAIERASELLGPDDPALTAVVVNWTPWTGAWTACETRLRRALEQTPHSIHLAGILGSMMVHSGRLSEGLELWRDIHLREPLQAVIAMAHGMCLNALERHEDAYARFEAAFRRWPDLSFLWRNLVAWGAREGRWDDVERWTAPVCVERFQKNPGLVEEVFADVELHRNPEASQQLLQQLADAVDRTGRARMNDIVHTAEFCDVDAVFDVVDQATFAHLLDPLQGYEAGDWGAQMLFSAGAKRLRDSPRFVKLCARLGLAAHWIETGRWPDCADQTPYDFRHEVREAANTPVG
jgi:adenylate cyclase